MTPRPRRPQKKEWFSSVLDDLEQNIRNYTLEEAARIADEHLADEREREGGQPMGHGQSISMGYQEACLEIATAIRALKEPRG